jgi:hypothetical protein
VSDELQGRRVEWPDDWRESEPGDYVKVPDGEGPRRPDGQPTWYIRDPDGKVGTLWTHTVTEHEDGTITVSPSILDNSPGGWHGYLERGVWRSV